MYRCAYRFFVDLDWLSGRLREGDYSVIRPLVGRITPSLRPLEGLLRVAGRGAASHARPGLIISSQVVPDSTEHPLFFRSCSAELGRHMQMLSDVRASLQPPIPSRRGELAS